MFLFVCFCFFNGNTRSPLTLWSSFVDVQLHIPGVPKTVHRGNATTNDFEVVVVVVVVVVVIVVVVVVVVCFLFFYVTFT